MTSTTMSLLSLAVVLTIVIGRASRGPLAGARARRRVAWELDRVEWRRWMSRPE